MVFQRSKVVVFVFLVFSKVTIQVSASALPHVPFSTQNLKQFLHNKCQNPLTKNAAIWSYEGRLVDPSNGNVIANVEGIELVRTLSETSSSGPNEKKDLWEIVRGLRRLDDLKVRSMLAGPGWEYAGTVLSRKLFCYSPVGEGGLLKEYRLHPTAPARKVKADEAVALYDTATTFISCEGGKEMVVMTEWPDGHWILSEATPLGFQGKGNDDEKKKSDGRKPFEFTVYARRSGKGEDPALPQKITAVGKKVGETSSILGSTPPRAKFIQFGKDDNADDRKFGARETYSYVMGGTDVGTGQRIRSIVREMVSNVKERVGLLDFDAGGSDEGVDPSRGCTVRYTRYGEAPPWYGPGKMCTLELWGKRVESVADAPPIAATLAATRVPGFLSVHTPIPVGPEDNSHKTGKRSKSLGQKQLKEQIVADEAAMKAVSWFRGKDSLPLEILKTDETEQNLVGTIVEIGLSVAQRLRAATTATSAAEL